jgi:hypothetical protein
MMQPMETILEVFAALYKGFGASHPKLSLVIITVVGGVLGAGLSCGFWLTAAAQYAKTEKTVPPTHVSGPASTSGDNSPSVTGDSNQIDYGKAEPKPKGKP